jgi:hypothetical protein
MAVKHILLRADESQENVNYSHMCEQILKTCDDFMQHSESRRFLTLSIVLYSNYWGTHRFENWMRLSRQVRGVKHPLCWVIRKG